MFVFDKERKLRYEGRVDNSYRTEMVTTRDARNAIRRVAGQPRCDSDAHRGVRLLDQVAGNICIAHRSTTNRSARGARYPGPSGRTGHQLDGQEHLPATADGARISGIDRPKFPEPTHVASVVFQITEENSVFEVNRVVPNLAFVDHAQDFRPDRCVIAFVTFLTTGLKPDHHSKALHRFHPESRAFLPLPGQFKCLKAA